MSDISTLDEAIRFLNAGENTCAECPDPHYAFDAGRLSSNTNVVLNIAASLGFATVPIERAVKTLGEIEVYRATTFRLFIQWVERVSERAKTANVARIGSFSVAALSSVHISDFCAYIQAYWENCLRLHDAMGGGSGIIAGCEPVAFAQVEMAKLAVVPGPDAIEYMRRCAHGAVWTAYDECKPGKQKIHRDEIVHIAVAMARLGDSPQWPTFVAKYSREFPEFSTRMLTALRANNQAPHQDAFPTGGAAGGELTNVREVRRKRGRKKRPETPTADDQKAIKVLKKCLPEYRANGRTDWDGFLSTCRHLLPTSWQDLEADALRMRVMRLSLFEPNGK